MSQGSLCGSCGRGAAHDRLMRSEERLAVKDEVVKMLREHYMIATPESRVANDLADFVVKSFRRVSP